MVGGNLTLVSIFFSDLGCLFLWIILISIILLLLGSLYSIGRFCAIALNASMLLGLYVDIYGNVLGMRIFFALLYLSFFL